MIRRTPGGITFTNRNVIQLKYHGALSVAIMKADMSILI